jgi:23S rRNA (adenine1618-N6)-methyltransferase
MRQALCFPTLIIVSLQQRAIKDVPEEMLEKSFHPRNKHKNGYDFANLAKTNPHLNSFLFENSNGHISIDFSDPEAVKTLNKTLLQKHYGIPNWKIPDGYLTPPIPSRVDYLHHMADLFDGKKNIRCLDIGVGANCIYPIVGHQEYGWDFVGSDIEKESLEAAQKNLDAHPFLKDAIELRQQSNANHIFNGIVKEGETFDCSICNPPFHSSEEAARKGTLRKGNNLNTSNAFNFGGQHHELWCQGGELLFLKNTIRESQYFKKQVTWFTSLVSKKENIRPLKVVLKKAKATRFKTIPMEHGNKISRILLWSYQ